MSGARAKATKPGTRFKFSEATTNAFEREEANYFALWRSQNPAGVKYGDLPKAQRDSLTNGRWEAVNRLIKLSCVQEDIVNSEGTVDEWKIAFMKRFTRRHEKLVKPSTAPVPAIPPKILDRLVDGLLDTTSGRKLFREKEAASIDQRRAEIQGRDGVTDASIGARAVAEAQLWADLTEERRVWYHNAAQSHNEGSHADLADLLAQLTGSIRKRYDPCLLTLVCTVADSSGQAQSIVVNSVPDNIDSSTGTIQHALEERLHCSIAVIANEKAKEVFKSLQQGEPVPRFLGEANEMDSSLSFAIGEVAEYLNAVWAHTFGEQAIPWSNIEDYFDKEKWAFPGGLKDPMLYDSWGALSPMLAYLRARCGPFAIPAFEFSSQRAPSHDTSYDSIPCFISNVSEKNSTLREALGEVRDFLAVLWVHASLEGDIHWDDIDSFYDTTRWSFPGGATDPTVACKSWASLREYLDFLRANCGPEVLNRFHFNTRLPRLSEHLDENDPKTPSQSSFSEHATVEEDGNGFDEPEDAERSCDEMDVDIEDLFNNGTYIGHDRKSDTSSDDSEPEEPVNDAAEPEIVEPGVTEREYEEPKTGGRKRKHEPPIPEVKEYYEEPPKKAKRRPGRPKTMVAPATIPDPVERKGRKKASHTTKINGARYAETTSPPRHFVPKVLETQLRNRASANISMVEKSPNVLLLEDILKTQYGKAALRSTLKCGLCGGNSIAFSVNMGVRNPQDFAKCTFACAQCRKPIRTDVPKAEEREAIREQWKQEVKARGIAIRYTTTLQAHRSDISDDDDEAGDEGEAGDESGPGGDANRADDIIQVQYFCTEEAISFNHPITKGVCTLSKIPLLEGCRRIKVYTPSYREFISMQTTNQHVYVEGATLICMDHSMNATDCRGLDQMLADLHAALPYKLNAPSIAGKVDEPEEKGSEVDSDSEIEFIDSNVPPTPPKTPAKGKGKQVAGPDIEFRRDGKKREASGDPEGAVAPVKNRRRF